MDLPEMLEMAEDLGLEKAAKEGENMQVVCPFHHSSTRGRKLGISLEAPHPWNCFVCHVRGTRLETFLMQLKRIDKSASVTYIKKFDPEFNPDVWQRKKKTANDAPMLPERTLYFYDDADTDEQQYHDYLSERLVSVETAKRCGVLYDALEKMLVIPVRGLPAFENEKVEDPQYTYNRLAPLRGFIKRAASDDVAKDKRYDNLKGEWKSRVLLGTDILPPEREDLYLVEGAFDWLRFVEIGYTSTLAIMGSHLSKTQEKQIRSLGFKRIFLCFDNNKAGWDCFDDCKKRLDGHALLFRLAWEDFAYDDVGCKKIPDLKVAVKFKLAYRKFKRVER